MSWQLRPLATLDELHPPGTALAARAPAGNFSWGTLEADTVETLSGTPLTVAGSLPVLAHSSATHAAAERLLSAAGLHLPQSGARYGSEAEALEVLRRWTSEGLRLAEVFPLPAAWAPENARLVPPSLFARLNSKACLAELVPPPFLPERRVLPRAAMGDAMQLFRGSAVALKVATAIGNGAGTGVFLCYSAQERAAALAGLERETRPFEALVVERWEEFDTLWCAGFAVLDGAVRWFGASRHRRNEKGMQAGNAMGDGAALPEEGRRAIEALGLRAAALGYRGLAGCDIGRTADGRLLIFDLNFRMNASTVMLLLQPAAAARSGLPAAINTALRAGLEPEALARRLLPWVEAGRLVPIRLLDHRLLPSRKALSSVSGLLLGESETACLALDAEIRGALA